MPKNKKPTKPAAKRLKKKQEQFAPAPKSQFPDWVDYEPLADFRMVAWDSDEKTVEILLTSYEYAVLKRYLAELRGYAPKEDAHA